jgi:uncharacterized protein YkwD
MAKKKSNTLLYVSIICGAIVLIALLIFGFSTQWTFKPKSNTSSKKEGNIEIGESLQYEDTPQSTSDDPIIHEKVIIKDDGTVVVSKQDGTTIKTDTYHSQQGDVKGEYATKMTEWHNEIRGKCKEFGTTGNLEWNDKLAKQATKYSVKLARRCGTCGEDGCELTHTLHDNGSNKPNTSYGSPIPASENLASYKISSGIPKNQESLLKIGKEAITGSSQTQSKYKGGWAGEGFNVNTKNYPLYSPTCTKGNTMSGHYTALNWSYSTHLGCGTSINDNGCAITVCHYANKKGNVWKTLIMGPGGGTQTKHTNRKEAVKCTEPLSLNERTGGIFKC